MPILMFVGSMLKSKFFWIFAALLALISYVYILNLSISKLETQIATLTSDNQICLIEKNNSLNELKKWQGYAKDSQKSFDKLADKLNAKRKVTNTKIDTLLKETTPDTCQKSIEYLLNLKGFNNE